MKISILTILILVGLFCGTAIGDEFCATEQCEEAQKIPNLPADVITFVDRRDGCDHFRGEPWDNGDDPIKKERREFIIKNLNEFCTGTDKQLEELREKYRDDATLSNLLEKYESKIELN